MNLFYKFLIFAFCCLLGNNAITAQENIDEKEKKKIEKQVKPEKVKKKLIGTWDYLNEFTWKPSVITFAEDGTETSNYRESQNKYKASRVFTFNEDGTCTITSKDEQKYPSIKGDLTWDVGYAKSEQGKYLPVVVITSPEGNFTEADIHTYGVQNFRRQMVLVLETCSNSYLFVYPEKKGFNYKGQPIHRFTKNLWFDNYIKRK